MEDPRGVSPSSYVHLLTFEKQVATLTYLGAALEVGVHGPCPWTMSMARCCGSHPSMYGMVSVDAASLLAAPMFDSAPREARHCSPRCTFGCCLGFRGVLRVAKAPLSRGQRHCEANPTLGIATRWMTPSLR